MNKDHQESNRPSQLMHSFWQLQKAIMGQVKQTAMDNALSVPQFAIMILMRHKKEMPQKKLQARTHFPKSTLSHAIEGLVQAEILTRTHVEGNRREMVLSLSAHGQTLLQEMTAQENGVHNRFKNAVESFSDEEFSALIDMHQHIISYFDGDEET
ncbi:hypothetical protein JNUCC1_00746 [Lentibacillus sp. JNUCC-1]|uniref:MarR family winged helix-turn-helix transcriptional regulator n=1 Tax=Lentibacillus sp. JNUCC-1 TaxID=2654513 RepID=UPI0012E83D92|nr:MarR family transcriptional regulator [Lentibacillus sp. JNUCC-1]MUV36942.1 hypothetical protein [Lentibacillus sp. JNUCC-1]